ncbi:hypothetical protein C9J12_01535 [Photobacterium frigidiphilum]|uniref:Uncharacterized protein n=1 Tax=Photobacterium frigidiphilum TaxID=264736 RepID=A0A2T3JRC8_9GAMM|nr:hypothetical protein C9J12_01535 [Photobacterium frigidiphilum]
MRVRAVINLIQLLSIEKKESKWSDNCVGKIDNNKAGIAVTSGSNYQVSNAVISNFNQRG